MLYIRHGTVSRYKAIVIYTGIPHTKLQLVCIHYTLAIQAAHSELCLWPAVELAIVVWQLYIQLLLCHRHC